MHKSTKPKSTDIVKNIVPTLYFRLFFLIFQ